MIKHRKPTLNPHSYPRIPVRRPDIPETGGIFALSHPDAPEEFRFIAGSRNMRGRYYNLISSARHQHQLNLDLEEWIRNILDTDREPIITILEHMSPDADKLAKTEFWLAQFDVSKLFNALRCTIDQKRQRHNVFVQDGLIRQTTKPIVRKGRYETEEQLAARVKLIEQGEKHIPPSESPLYLQQVSALRQRHLEIRKHINAQKAALKKATTQAIVAANREFRAARAKHRTRPAKIEQARLKQQRAHTRLKAEYLRSIGKLNFELRLRLSAAQLNVQPR